MLKIYIQIKFRACNVCLCTAFKEVQSGLDSSLVPPAKRFEFLTWPTGTVERNLNSSHNRMYMTNYK